MDKKSVLQMLLADCCRINQELGDIEKSRKEHHSDTSNYIQALLAQMTTSGSGLLLAKTPKVPKKKGTRIKAIPENDEMEIDRTDSILSNTSSSRSSRAENVTLEISDIRPSRAKRGASIKAADIIKKQQSISLHAKLRRPSNGNSDLSVTNKIANESRSKRPKESIASSDEEHVRPSKQSKIEKKKAQSKSRINDETHVIANDSTQIIEEDRTTNSERPRQTSMKRKLEEPNEDAETTLTSKNSTRQNTSSNDEPAAKKANYSNADSLNEKEMSKFMSTLNRISEKSVESETKKSNERVTRASSIINNQCLKTYKINNIINETVDMSNADETVASMYEDAIGKPIPIMNSTMNPSSSAALEKMMNATVVIEPLSRKVFNETVTIKKSSFKEPLSRNNSTIKEKEENIEGKLLPPMSSKKSASEVQRNLKSTSQKDVIIDKFNELITDDESSPERKEYKARKAKLLSNQQKRKTRSNHSLTSDDEILDTPIGKIQPNKDIKGTATKSVFKQKALFSPYAKDSVKNRVAAYEQVSVSPKQDYETAGRVTRTKTRALAAASFSEAPATTVAQKLARKSLAKAKKISLAKKAKEHDDTKENENTNIVKPKKISNTSEKSTQNQKTTPLGKSRMIPVPSSANKNLYATPSNSQNLNGYTKPLTASRGNIVSHVDSFIQPMKSASKQIDRAAEEKRRRAHDEDAKKKREELLKAQAEEKRRKREEKELKNRLAREAKEKLEYEKRLKAEREREEKAKLAQQMQEKQKEEMERRRIALMQRALEKEERRKQEELLRLQRLQEQEELDKQLAEQKRREQEMEKRRQAEIKQQMAMKNHMDKALLQAKAKILVQKHVPTSYKIDSDPDEEDSDDESKPKHQIPQWASKHVRQTQLAMQQHIPMRTVLEFFDAKKCTPDLKELFKGIDPKKLKRSSSAIWKTPPRYSMMNCSIIKD